MFKNLSIYRLPTDWSITAAEFEDQLSRRPLRPCGPFDMSSSGWVPILRGGRLLHTVNQQFMIALGVDEKLLPGSVVRQVADERAQALEQEQGFRVGRKQMRDLRGKVADELRARAFTRRREIRAWLDPVGGWFVIDAASTPRAESVVDALAETLGSFLPQTIGTDRSPAATMTSWLIRGEAPLRFAVDDELELQSSDQSKTVIRYVRHPLDGKEIRGHLGAGKFPTRLALTWNDRVSFVLTDKLQVKRVEFLELAKDESGGQDDDPVERFDAEFAVMAGELGGLLKDLVHALGSDPSAVNAWGARSKVA